MTKVDIISGFLGAGKTTLISKLLKEALPDEQVVLIENEFGEIGIDGGFLKDSGVEIRASVVISIRNMYSSFWTMVRHTSLSILHTSRSYR